MAYKVEIEKSGIEFTFINIDDALNFASMAAEYGSVEDYHFERDVNGEPFRVSDGWRPVIVSYTKIKDPETMTIYADGAPIMEVAPNE